MREIHEISFLLRPLFKFIRLILPLLCSDVYNVDLDLHPCRSRFVK